MADRLVKHGRLARSGIYQYARREIESLGLPWPPPPEIGDKPSYSILRPASVLAKAVKDGMFTRMPMTRGHPDEWVEPHNFKKYTVGYTGDTAGIEYLPKEKEIAVTGSMALAADEAIDAYERGVVDLSPGYGATFVWKKGKLSDGRTYDAVMSSIVDTNHLALVNKGRGGATAAIFDAEGSMTAKKIASGLWWRVKKRFLVKDESMVGLPASSATGFHSSLNQLIDGRAAKNDDEIERGVEELKKLLVDLPDGNEKGLLMTYMEDMKVMKEEKDDVVQEAAHLACALFDKLDKKALGGESEDASMKDCNDCHGSGKIGDIECVTCEGSGKVKDEPAGTAPAKGDPPMDKPAGKAGDEPDPSVPATVPPAPPKQPASPAPGGVPSVVPGAEPAAAAQGGPQFWMGKLAELLKGMMADPQIQALMAPAAAPAATPAAVPGAAPGAVAPAAVPAVAPSAVPAAPAAPAAAPASHPAPAAAPSAPPPGGEVKPDEKKEPPPGGAKDSASSLTALLGSSQASQPAGNTLEAIVETIHGKKG